MLCTHSLTLFVATGKEKQQSLPSVQTWADPGSLSFIRPCTCPQLVGSDGTSVKRDMIDDDDVTLRFWACCQFGACRTPALKCVFGQHGSDDVWWQKKRKKMVPWFFLNHLTLQASFSQYAFYLFISHSLRWFYFFILKHFTQAVSVNISPRLVSPHLCPFIFFPSSLYIIPVTFLYPFIYNLPSTHFISVFPVQRSSLLFVLLFPVSYSLLILVSPS